MTKPRHVLLTAIVLIAMVSFCSAEMSIYLKNGGQYLVRKIVFNGSQAELYLTNGSVVNLPVQDIDLTASGIGSPTGTYGEKTLSGGSTPAQAPSHPPVLVNQQLRQQELRDEWKSSEKSAIATHDYAQFHTGQVVHIVERNLSPEQKPEDVYWGEPPPGAQVQDQAYIVVYMNPDGTFGKKMIDATVFSQNFTIQGQTTVPAPVADNNLANPEPDTTSPEDLSSTPASPPPTTTEKEPKVVPTPAQKKSDPPIVAKPGSSNLVVFAVIGIVAVLSGGAVSFAMKNRKKPFINSSKFHLYEEELRDFEIEIWLKNGRTADQLMDTCTKKFYQDNPAVLSVVSKMLKGTPRTSVVPYIAKSAEVDSPRAQEIYMEIERRIEWIRAMIQTVSNRIGVAPAAAPEPQKPVAAEPKPRTVPLPPKVEAAPVVQAAAPPISEPQKNEPAAWESIGRMVPEQAPTPTPNDLPPYFKHTYKHLSTLGN